MSLAKKIGFSIGTLVGKAERRAEEKYRQVVGEKVLEKQEEIKVREKALVEYENELNRRTQMLREIERSLDACYVFRKTTFNVSVVVSVLALVIAVGLFR